MFNRILLATACNLVFAGAVFAQGCPGSSLYDFTTGSTANATQLTGNFNILKNCFSNIYNSSGNIGIGTATPQFTLSVAGQYAQIGRDKSTTSNFISVIFGDVTSGFQQLYWHPTVQSFVFTAGLNTNGPSGGPSAWINYSDARLKKSIVPLTGGLAIINQLRPVRFSWRAAADRSIGKDITLDVNKPQVGLIAQEVAAVIPEVVQPPTSSDQPYGLKEGDLIPVMIAAIKEQQAQIDALNAQISALKQAISTP